jgi:D-glycero-D-manno-heptose 1,7-bisphosphate phosphatase
LKIFPEAFDAIRLINQSGMKAVVISNQSGVARGYFDEAFVETVHDRIQSLLEKHKAWIDRFYYCPHHPTEGTGLYRTACKCRKPEAGLLFRASQEMGIDLARSYMVGDMPKDIEAAGKAGAKGILVQTGYGMDHLFFSSVQPGYIARNILDAVAWIMKDRQT